MAVTTGCPNMVKLKLLWPVNAVLFLLILINALLVAVEGTTQPYIFAVDETLLSIVTQLLPLSEEYSIVKLLASLP